MKKQIIVQDKNVVYTLRQSKRARRMRLVVYRDGSIVITTPYHLQKTIVEKFIRDKARWLFSKLNFFKQFQEKPVMRYHRNEFLMHKESARSLVETKAMQLSSAYGYRYNKINIKNQRTCWGSCSKKGNLNFNYKILFLPEKTQDYIVAHELCHLKEFNHSKRFWGLVAEIMPGYRQIRNELKKSGIVV